ncbi:MAG: MFS transporter [Cellvibrionaceae bacterium]|nr:MFS transporter [Cellvibrionaceae bacterium]
MQTPVDSTAGQSTANSTEHDINHGATEAPAKEKPKKESLLANLLLNIVIPTLILTKFSGDEYLGTKWGVVVALAFPILYGAKDFITQRKINFFSALGVISVGLTGGMSLMELPPQYIAIKEAAIPALLGIATMVSIKTPYPLVRTFLYNDNFLQTDKVEAALLEQGNMGNFDRAMVNASAMIAASFLLSSALNYILATWILVSEPGTEAFNAELGKMTALSFPVIAVPATIIMMATLFYVFRSITRLTGLSLDDIMVEQ